MTRWQRALWLTHISLRVARVVVDGAMNTLAAVEREVLSSVEQASIARTADEMMDEAVTENPDTFDMDPRDLYS